MTGVSTETLKNVVPDGLATAKEAWERWLEAEMTYWHLAFVSDEPWAAQLRDEFRALCDPRRDVDPSVAQLLGEIGGNRVLEIGAGPLSRVGYVMDGEPVRLTSIDSMALYHQRLLDHHGFVAPQRSVQMDPERLRQGMPDQVFDLVVLREALHRCWNPAQALGCAFDMLRPGGRLLISGQENIGATTGYFAFHQWNLTAEDDDLIVWRPGCSLSVREILNRPDGMEVIQTGTSIRAIVERR